jgi:hypothetical protein
MGTNESTHLTHPTTPGSAHGSGRSPGTHWGDTEAAAGIHVDDVLGEGLGSSWEAAWIDVGGEG